MFMVKYNVSTIDFIFMHISGTHGHVYEDPGGWRDMSDCSLS